ncbi:MAG: TonB-dependent receptor [Myxococcaceae bacterium]|nr:TonB-dependent receptor [Myxococcaceae bacterium]
MQRLFLLLALWATAPLAQTLTKAPTLVKSVEPEFPAEAMDAGAGASVVMDIEIGVDGTVTAAKVVQSAGPAFDAAALAAARQFVFTPAEVDGQPAPVRIQFTSNFTVKTQVVEAPLVQDAGVPVVNFKGRLKASGTREPIAAASVTVAGVEAVSDDQGRFELTDVPFGSVSVTVSAAGFEPFTETEEVKPGERTEVTYSLKRTGVFETVVRGQKDRREVTQVRLTQSEFRMVAGSNNDAFKVVQNLPGVARSPFGGGLLVVRGSKAWDSRVYVDEIQIPQLFHFAGVVSTFNSANLEAIAFQPGNFGVDYGRSIGGLITADAKTPSKSGVHGFVDVNVFDVSAMVEAPVTDTWSVSGSARYGLAQWVLPAAIRAFAPPGSVGFGLAPEYWDYQVRAERKVANSKNRLFLAAFGSSDRWAFLTPNRLLDPDIEGNTVSAGSSTLYNRLVFGLDQRLGERLTFISRNSVGLDVNTQSSTVQEIFFRNTQVPVQLRERFKLDVPEAKLVFNAGLDALVTPTSFDAQRPPVFSPNQLPDPYVTRRLIAATERSVYVEPGLFLDATWTPLESLQVRGGLRMDGELAVMKKVWLNPRLAVRYTPLDVLTVKAGAAMYQQPPDYRTGQLSPVFGDPSLRPEGAWHFMGGAELRLFKLLEVDLQGYYKALFNQARLSLASGEGSDISIPGAKTRYTSDGYGRAYGGEVLVRVRPTKYFLGWVSYSLSRFERDAYGGAQYAPGPLDQPHNLIVVGSVQLPWNVNVGARFRYASGPLVTPIASSLFDAQANLYVPIPALPWSRRLPDFLQLDVRVDKRFVFENWSLVAYLDVQNATNRQNPEALFYNFNYSESAFVYSIPILPTVGVRGEW